MSEVVLQQIDERIAREENIFLFLPNIIGRKSTVPARTNTDTQQATPGSY